VLLAVALQEKQVWALVQGVTHSLRAGLLRALSCVRQGSGWAQAGFADRAAQPGWRRAPSSLWGQGSLGAAPLQPPGLGIYPWDSIGTGQWSRVSA
jgi:hypothetical protein